MSEETYAKLSQELKLQVLAALKGETTGTFTDEVAKAFDVLPAQVKVNFVSTTAVVLIVPVQIQVSFD
jgi:hypothetical protein